MFVIADAKSFTAPRERQVSLSPPYASSIWPNAIAARVTFAPRSPGSRCPGARKLGSKSAGRSSVLRTICAIQPNASSSVCRSPRSPAAIVIGSEFLRLYGEPRPVRVGLPTFRWLFREDCTARRSYRRPTRGCPPGRRKGCLRCCRFLPSLPTPRPLPLPPQPDPDPRPLSVVRCLLASSLPQPPPGGWRLFLPVLPSPVDVVLVAPPPPPPLLPPPPSDRGPASAAALFSRNLTDRTRGARRTKTIGVGQKGKVEQPRASWEQGRLMCVFASRKTYAVKNNLQTLRPNR